MSYIPSMYRAVQVFRAMKFPETYRIIALFMLGDPRPWTVAALHKVTGYSRHTVYVVLDHGIARGYAQKGPTGYSLTDPGRAFLTRLFDAIGAISAGATDRFPEDLIQDFEALPPGSGPFRLEMPRGRIV